MNSMQRDTFEMLIQERRSGRQWWDLSAPLFPPSLPYISPGSQGKQLLLVEEAAEHWGADSLGSLEWTLPESKHPLTSEMHIYLWCPRQVGAGPPRACPQSRSLGQQTGLQPMPVAAGAQEAPAPKTAVNQGQNWVWRQSTPSIRTTLYSGSDIWLATPSSLQKNKTYLTPGLLPISSPEGRDLACVPLLGL